MPSISFTLLIGMAPAPAPVVDAVQEIEVESSVEMASVFRLRLGISQTPIGDWTVLQEDLFRPLVPVQIRVANGLGIPEALINGYVSSQQVTFADAPGETVLEIDGTDATLLMNLQEKVMPWPNLPDGAIAAAIFGQYALLPRVTPTSPQLVEPEGTTTQRGSDIRFLKRLAQRNGFDCFVQPEPITGLDQGFFQPPQLMGMPQAVLNVNMGPQTNVAGFRVSYQMTQPTTATASTVDVSNKSVALGLAPASLATPMGLEPSLLRVPSPPVVRLADTGFGKTAELQALAQSVVDRSSFALSAEGRLDPTVSAILRPGGIVNIRGLGRVYNGSYYVTRVTHTINREGYTQTFRAIRNAATMTGAELFVEI